MDHLRLPSIAYSALLLLYRPPYPSWTCTTMVLHSQLAVRSIWNIRTWRALVGTKRLVAMETAYTNRVVQGW